MHAQEPCHAIALFHKVLIPPSRIALVITCYKTAGGCQPNRFTLPSSNTAQRPCREVCNPLPETGLPKISSVGLKKRSPRTGQGSNGRNLCKSRCALAVILYHKGAAVCNTKCIIRCRTFLQSGFQRFQQGCQA